jgi:hypothetical protein
MVYAEPHENLSQHMANIEAAVEGERAAMDVADAESRLARRSWRNFSLWLANDSYERGLPRGYNGRRLVKAKLVWWASKKSSTRYVDINRVCADSGRKWLSGRMMPTSGGGGRTP